MKSLLRQILFYLALAALSIGCVTDKNVLTVTTPFRKKTGAIATVTTITHTNDELIVSGSNFSGVTNVTLNGTGLTVTPNSDTQMTLSGGLNLMALAMNTALNLVITNAAGAAPVSVTFSLSSDSVLSAHIADGQIGTTELADGAVTAVKLDSMGAGIGQVLKYNGTTWVASDLSGLTYAGNWDANTNSPNLSGAGSLGEYYIISTAGATDLSGGTGTNSWNIGDWAVWNNVAGQWEKVDNATNVQSFNGRSGTVTAAVNDYTWAQIDKTAAPINDLSDVDTTGVAAGKILKWDGSKWAVSDDLNGGGAGSVTTTEIADGTILDTDIDAAAAIAQSKISGLAASFAAKEPTLTKGDLTEATSTVLTIIGGVAAVIGTGTSIQVKQANTTTDGYLSSADWNTFNGKAVSDTHAGSICAGGTFLNGDGSCDAGFLDADGIDDYNAAFDTEAEIDAAVSNNGFGTGDLLANGGVAMTAALDASTFGIKLKDGDANYVTVKANAAMGADFNFILPTDSGTNGQVLKTDGTGNLAWINASTGSVTTVSGTAPVVSSGGTTPAISMAQANGTTDGYLAQADWTTFNNKQSAITTGTTAQYFKGDLSLGTFMTDVRSSILTGFVSGTGAISAADTILSSINKLDGNIAGKEPTLTKGNLTEATSTVLTITNGTAVVIGAGTSIQVNQANTTTNGYLSSADWNIFNNKQAALTNPITGSAATTQVAYFNGATTQVGSANLTFDGTNLTVGGDIKIGNAGAACNIGNEGKQRYNSTYKNMQFCDGTIWREVGNDFWADSKGCIPAENTSDEMVAVGDYCVDKYEASVWSDRAASATQYFSNGTNADLNYPDAGNIPANFNRDGSGSNNSVFAVSKAGVIPARGITWYQASITCANSGKELIPDHIWQLAVLGTVDGSTGTGGTGGGSTADVAAAQCNIATSVTSTGTWTEANNNVRRTNRAGATSSGTNACISRFGVQDMIGNLWEWTSANGIQAGADQTAFTQGESNAAGNPFSTADTSWNLNGSAYGCDGTGSTKGACGWKNNVAVAARRGGGWSNGTSAGAFALFLNNSGSRSGWSLGFRCARSR